MTKTRSRRSIGARLSLFAAALCIALGIILADRTHSVVLADSQKADKSFAPLAREVATVEQRRLG
jgi:hypothetical protein